MTSIKTQGLLFVASLALLLVFAMPVITNVTSSIIPESSFTLHIDSSTTAQLQLEPITKTGAFLLEVTNTGKNPTVVEFDLSAQVVTWFKTNRELATQSGTSFLQRYQLEPAAGLTLQYPSTVTSLHIRNKNAIPLLLQYTWVDLRNYSTISNSLATNDTLVVLENSTK